MPCGNLSSLRQYHHRYSYTTDHGRILEPGWYASGYLLTTCDFQLSYGKLYKLFPTKWVFLSTLGTFEVGSLVCGAEPDSVVLIMGRVVASIGSGGMFSGAVLIIAASVPLEERAAYNGLLRSIYAIARVAGPLIGREYWSNISKDFVF